MKKENIFKRMIKRIQSIPHLFAKITVIFCVLFAAGCSVYTMRIMMYTDHNPSQLLGVILAFFGGELLLMCLKTIFSKSDKSSTPSDTRSSNTENTEYNDNGDYTNF